MYKNTTALSVAISLALGTAAVAPLAAQAEEQQVEKLQKMKVTGSRLTRASMEGSTPVAVIGRAEIERTGNNSSSFDRSNSERYVTSVVKVIASQQQ